MMCRQRLTSTSRVALLIGAVAVITLALSSVMWASSKPSYVPNEYLIRVRAGSTLAQVNAVAARIGATVLRALPLADSYVIKLTGSAARAGTAVGGPMKALGSPWIIEAIQPNFLYYPTATPNDPLFSEQWGMRMMGMPAVWESIKGSDTVTVAVLDTGVAYDHPDLQDEFGNPRCLPGYDFADGTSDPYDKEGHGTHVAGIIAAQGDNAIGVTGVCWEGVKILPVKVLGPLGGTTDWIISGLDFAKLHGANVVNMSLGGAGGGPTDSLFQAKIRELTNASPPIIVVAAAGNSGDTSVPDVSVPAAFPECIAVAAVGPTQQIAYYSSFGPGNQVDIAAPGGDYKVGGDAGLIMSTIVNYTRDSSGNVTAKDLTYAGEQGTSMACPHVAGAAAILLSAGVPPALVRKQLTETTFRPATGYDPMKFGTGIVDVKAALAGSSVKITAPVNGATTSSTPDVAVSLRGIRLESVEVFLDYPDSNGDGIPDVGTLPLISALNIDTFFDAVTGAVEFSLPMRGGVALVPGSHKLYAQATSIIDAKTISDQSTFTVASKLVSGGIYLFAFPHLINSATDDPSVLLQGTTFASGVAGRSRLIRWIATPRSTTDPTQNGYVTFDPSNTADFAWRLPSIPGTSAVVNGGFYQTVGGGSASSTVIGSGYWLVLAASAGLTESLPSLDGSATFDGSKGYTVRLYDGWNMIGNPYPHRVPWQTSLFKYQGQTKTLFGAVDAGWMSPLAYGFDSTQSTDYRRVTDRDSLEPYRGYWVRSQVGTVDNPLELIILP